MGYTGPNCTTRCLYPEYGQGCQSVCKCTKKDCNYVYGCKNTTGNVCIGCYLHFMLKWLLEYNDMYLCENKYMANCFSNWKRDGVECCQGHKWNNEETSCIRRYKLCNFLSYATFCLIIYRIINKLLTFFPYHLMFSLFVIF